MVTQLGDRVRTSNSNGSCALPLGLVACGKADALVQPLQSPWDWAAGKVFIEEAGGKMIFYEMDERGGIRPVDRLEPRHYNPEERTVGFVAASERNAYDILDMLLVTGSD